MSSRSSSARAAAPSSMVTPENLRSGADSELGCDGLVVNAVADLAREAHRPLRLAHAVPGESAGGGDECLGPEPEPVAAAAGARAPGLHARLRTTRRRYPDGAVAVDSAPGDP